MISKEYYKYKRSSLKQVVSHIVFKLVFPSLSLVNQLHLGIKPHEKTSFSQPMLFFWTSLLTILFDDFPPPNLNTNFFFIITFAFSHYPILISLFFFGLFYPFEPNKGGGGFTRQLLFLHWNRWRRRGEGCERVNVAD